MRLLMAWPDKTSAWNLRCLMEARGWEVELLFDGRELEILSGVFDVLLVHLCLPGMDGLSAGNALAKRRLLRPPRILFAAPSEWCAVHPSWADCTVEAGIQLPRLCRLIEVLAKKPLPKLAAAAQPQIAAATDAFLDALSFPVHMKGRRYAAWLITRMVPSTEDDQLAILYAGCAHAFSTTPAAVERSLRTAVEYVFTKGSMEGIELFFGATVDPERGKPTNRAFLMQAVELLRFQMDYSRTTARSLNSREMHHSPAAPTSEYTMRLSMAP